MATFEPDLKSGTSFTTGQTIRIRDVSVSDADMVMTGRGGLVSDMHGRLGGIATVSEVISDDKLRLTYDGGGSHVWSPALVMAIPPDELASLPERVRVGSIVVMARGSTPEGVLTNGRLGRVITDDGSGMPYNVLSIDGGTTHWYRSNQVELASEAQQETARLAVEAKKGTSSGGFSFASGQRVRIKSMGIEDAKAKMVDHGGWADAMESLLGTTATVLQVVSETKVKLQHAGTTWVWNPAMVENSLTVSDTSAMTSSHSASVPATATANAPALESAQEALVSVGDPEGGDDFTVGQTVLIRQLGAGQAKAEMRNRRKQCKIS